MLIENRSWCSLTHGWVGGFFLKVQSPSLPHHLVPFLDPGFPSPPGSWLPRLVLSGDSNSKGRFYSPQNSDRFSKVSFCEWFSQASVSGGKGSPGWPSVGATSSRACEEMAQLYPTGQWFPQMGNRRIKWLWDRQTLSLQYSFPFAYIF